VAAADAERIQTLKRRLELIGTLLDSTPRSEVRGILSGILADGQRDLARLIVKSAAPA
jgi:hypothetical protein